MMVPDKLDPIPGLDMSVLPAWVEQFGCFRDAQEVDRGGTLVIMKAHWNGEVHHVSALCPEQDFNDTFWVRYAEPMVNCLGSSLFEAEHPGKTMPSFHWDALSFYGEPLTEEQTAIIARRKELTWTSPIRVLPD